MMPGSKNKERGLQYRLMLFGCQQGLPQKGFDDLRRLIQKQNLQVSRAELVKTPPRAGPTTEATPYMLVTILSNSGRCRISTICVMMIKPPQKSPAAPSPATALPAMKDGEFGAAAQMTDPASKRTKAPR